MHYLIILSGIEWKMLLLGGEEWDFLIETVLRTFIMFIVVLISLRLLGKRGIKQLSVFELVVIVGLGSAAGDPMFYKEVGLLPALVVFSLVITMYKIVVYFIGKNKKFEILVEGKPVTLIRKGVFSIENFKKEALGEDEFFSELRMLNVSQLGQIEEAILESSGNISVFYYDEQDVKYGLPVMPGALEHTVSSISTPGYYSCSFCGFTDKMEPFTSKKCPTCRKNLWVLSSNRKRNK